MRIVVRVEAGVEVRVGRRVRKVLNRRRGRGGRVLRVVRRGKMRTGRSERGFGCSVILWL